MEDTYQQDYNILKEQGRKIYEDIKTRKAMTQSKQFAVTFEEKIYKNLEEFKQKTEASIRNYTNKFKAGNQVAPQEATKRINLLQGLIQFHNDMKEELDNILNETYKYVIPNIIYFNSIINDTIF